MKPETDITAFPAGFRWPRIQLLHFLESVAVAFTVCVFQSLVVFGLRVESWMHELAGLLEHFVRASPVGRVPVEVAGTCLFGLTLVVVVIARRNREHDHE